MVDAGVSLHFQTESDCPDATNLTKAEIKDAIDSGSFNELEDRIVNIRYVEESDLDFSSSANSIDTGYTTSGNDQVLPGYAWALIALAGVFSILSVGLMVKRQHDRSRDAELTAFPSHADGIDIDCPPSISENTWHDQDESNEESSEKVLSTENEAILPLIDDSQEDILFLSRTESRMSGEGNIVVDPTTEEEEEAHDVGDSSPLDSKPKPEPDDDTNSIPHVASIPPDVEDTSGEDTDDDATEMIKGEVEI